MAGQDDWVGKWSGKKDPVMRVPAGWDVGGEEARTVVLAGEIAGNDEKSVSS